jgi:hypothetical protein
MKDLKEIFHTASGNQFHPQNTLMSLTKMKELTRLDKTMLDKTSLVLAFRKL